MTPEDKKKISLLKKDLKYDIRNLKKVSRKLKTLGATAAVDTIDDFSTGIDEMVKSFTGNIEDAMADIPDDTEINCVAESLHDLGLREMYNTINDSLTSVENSFYEYDSIINEAEVCKCCKRKL